MCYNIRRWEQWGHMRKRKNMRTRPPARSRRSRIGGVHGVPMDVYPMDVHMRPIAVLNAFCRNHNTFKRESEMNFQSSGCMTLVWVCFFFDIFIVKVYFSHSLYDTPLKNWKKGTVFTTLFTTLFMLEIDFFYFWCIAMFLVFLSFQKAQNLEIALF